MVKIDSSAIRQHRAPDADIVFHAARGVLLEPHRRSGRYGWLPVKHADGRAGWLPAHEAWVGYFDEHGFDGHASMNIAPMKLAVLGAGAWGTALAASWATTMTSPCGGATVAELDAMRTRRVNTHYLPGCPLPDALHFSPDFDSVA